MHIIGYTNLTEVIGIDASTKLAGSSAYRNIGTAIYKRERENYPRALTGGIANRYAQIMGWLPKLGLKSADELAQHSHIGISRQKHYVNLYREMNKLVTEIPPVRRAKYKLNKQKVRKRAIALCRLEQSKQFLAFYSISFPAQSEDKHLYEIFNRWLTNCRTRYGLKTYLWVAERQRNGTLHFHILTNNRMDIQTVNKAMANAIQTSVGQNKISWGQSSRELYNGVDVDSIHKPKKRQKESRMQYRRRLKEFRNKSSANRVRFAINYLTKYISKNDDEFNHLPFHCSRDISQLFTSMVLSRKDFEKYEQFFSDDADSYKIIQNDNRVTYLYLKAQSDRLFALLDRVNDMLFSYYHSPPEHKSGSQLIADISHLL